MSVRIAATWRIHPGQQEAFVKLASTWKPIGERFHIRNQQLLQVAAGGVEMPLNTMTYTGEFPSGAEYGAWLDAQSGDAEIQGWFAKALAKDAPADLIATEILTEVPGF